MACLRYKLSGCLIENYALRQPLCSSLSFWLFFSFIGTWRSLVARLLGVQEAVGSNPAVPISFLDHLPLSHRHRRKLLDVLPERRRHGFVFRHAIVKGHAFGQCQRG